MPVEYGHGVKQHLSDTEGAITQYTKWFEMHGYDYSLMYQNKSFYVLAYKRGTSETIRCEAADTVQAALHNAYCKIKYK